MHSVATLRISSGGTNSTALSDYWGANPANVAMQFANDISIQAPAALTAVVTLQSRAVAGGTWSAVQEGGADVTIAAGKTRTLLGLQAADLRLVSAGAEGADRDFFVTIQESI